MKAKQGVLVSWFGNADLKAAANEGHAGIGPVAGALAVNDYDEVVLLSTFSDAETNRFLKWLRSRSNADIRVEKAPLSSPTNHAEIYAAAIRVVEGIKKKSKDRVALTFHLSPGTPAMHAVWLLLAKSRYQAALIESSKEQGVHPVTVPFEISAEFIPDLVAAADTRVENLAAGQVAETSGFEQILHRSKVMERVIEQARRVAGRTLPVLIEGESGTGKELMARAIHSASLRRDKAFVAVNCGAIPAELVESEFFGHKKGAFTGATADRAGHFEVAHQGTLFLDEVGELPLPVQVKLLRALQEKQVTRVGDSRAVTVDVRIIAATNRTLIKEVREGRFREDLFFRLAVGVLRLPALREREGDLGLLIDHALAEVNAQSGLVHKKLSVKARNILIQHSWPGNVRELSNTLQRASLWSDDETIGHEAVVDAIFAPAVEQGSTLDVLGRELDENLKLQDVFGEVARHYLARAWEQAGGNKTKAAALLGFKNYQTYSNWAKKHRVS
jgi:transcriptional regulator with PAS, ATPase and Fis domain